MRWRGTPTQHLYRRLSSGCGKLVRCCDGWMAGRVEGAGSRVCGGCDDGPARAGGGAQEPLAWAA